MQFNPGVPRSFVWTKFGSEAGETTPQIIARKEQERLLNGGVFLWGVGNNVGYSIESLVDELEPEVIFSPIASAPRSVDVAPEAIFVWSVAHSLNGNRFDIPANSIVTSRGFPKKRFHYALVCHSNEPLQFKYGKENVFSGALRNLVSGRQLGSSQVTSVVHRTEDTLGRPYPVALRVRLAAPYFVRLSCPVPLEVFRDTNGRRSSQYVKSDRIDMPSTILSASRWSSMT